MKKITTFSAFILLAIVCPGDSQMTAAAAALPGGNDGKSMISLSAKSGNNSGETGKNVSSKKSTVMKTGDITKIYGPSPQNQKASLSYPRIVEIQHSKKNKGTLIATSEGVYKLTFGIHRSTDRGKTWEYISDAAEQMEPESYDAKWQPHLYELPCDIGEMKKGTLLLSAISKRDYDKKHCERKLAIWKSADCGKTWKQFVTLDRSSHEDKAVAEPFCICTDDGKLVCFYSDESEVWKTGGQRLVYRISEDGINWSKKFYFAAPEDEKLRPGMVVITRLGNGKYLAVYEMIKSKPNGEVYFKISGSLTDWDARNPGARVLSGETSLCATPAVIWTPAGGKCGTVIAAGWRMTKDTANYGAALFISRDCGKSWETIDNPIYNEYKERYTRGYSPGFFTGADGIVYYVNSKDAGALYPNKTDLLFTTLTFKD